MKLTYSIVYIVCINVVLILFSPLKVMAVDDITNNSQSDLNPPEQVTNDLDINVYPNASGSMFWFVIKDGDSNTIYTKN